MGKSITDDDIIKHKKNADLVAYWIESHRGI